MTFDSPLPVFRERRRVMAAQVALRRQQEAQLKRHLTQELMRGAAPPKAPSHVKKGVTRPGVHCKCHWLWPEEFRQKKLK